VTIQADLAQATGQTAMADTEQVDNEINLEQLKVLKEVFEVRGAWQN
jgi:hypothetical protein